jgi:hypothetical protein
MTFIEIDLGEGFRYGFNLNHLVKYDITPTNDPLRFNLMLTFLGNMCSHHELDISKVGEFYQKLKEHSFLLEKN